VSRTAYAEKPLRVEYELTDAAYGLSPTFMELLNWSKRYGLPQHPTGSEAQLGTGPAQ
jgi:DNA-binding HxlR family transcriptional regulator